MTLLLPILPAVTRDIAKCALACAPSHANVKVAVSASVTATITSTANVTTRLGFSFDTGLCS